MKVSTDLYQPDIVAGSPRKYSLPGGLVGFPEHRSFELSSVEDQAPFLWLHLIGPERLDFVVIEPSGVIPGYELELFDEDADFLGIKSAEDAFILNVVTVPHKDPGAATVNLAGPIVINRHTGIGKQCILANYFRYSAHHPLVDSASAAR